MMIRVLLKVLHLQQILASVWIVVIIASTIGTETVSTVSAAAPIPKSTPSPSPTTTIEGKLYYPIIDRSTNEFIPYNRTTKITLNHGVDYVTYSQADGRFVIRNVKPGIHIIDIHDVIYHFPQIKCQYKIADDSNHHQLSTTVSCLEYLYPGATKQSIEVPLKIYATAQYDYFEQRKGFSILSIVSNPMMILMAFTFGMMFLMPKLMEGMDDEERERVKKQMEMQKDPTKMLGELWGSLSGGGTQQQPSLDESASSSSRKKTIRH